MAAGERDVRPGAEPRALLELDERRRGVRAALPGGGDRGGAVALRERAPRPGHPRPLRVPLPLAHQPRVPHQRRRRLHHPDRQRPLTGELHFSNPLAV